METKELLKNIGGRTNNDIYIGVVGPVRTGKSTFIKKFIENVVLPCIDNDDQKRRTIDELPQSGSGKTIMTTEPKFVPNNAVTINVGDDFNVKLERSLTKALKDIQISLTEAQANELDEIQKISDDVEYEIRNGECHLCGSLAMFDAYCNKCGALVLVDADGDNYSVNDDKIYEFDFNCNENVIHCPKCNNTKMDIEFADYCGYCQYKLDKAFDED